MSDTKIEQPLIWNLPVTASMGSETGQREENQDRAAAFSSPFGMVYIVADGMGGHKGGAEAAQRTVDGFERRLLSIPATTPFPAAVSLAATDTHQELAALGSSGDPNFSGMGSTVVIALIRPVGEGFELVAAHMGDSRLYLHRAGQLTLLTRDHTQVQWLVDSNEIDEEGARSHPDASVLTRALGHGSGAVIDVSEPIPLGDGDGILLCSDGLSGFASSQEIDRTIKQFPEAADCVRELIRLALDRGSNDNVTVQFLRVGNQPAPIVPAPKQKRKTLPEGPVITAAPPQYYHPPPSTTVNRGPLFAGAAIGLVLVAGGAFVFRDKPFPAHKTEARVDSTETTIARLRGEASRISEDASGGERDVRTYLLALSGAHGNGAANAQTRSKLEDLRLRIHHLNSEARTISGQITRLSPKDASGAASIRDSLRDDRKSLDDALGELGKLRPASLPAAESPPHSRKTGPDKKTIEGGTHGK